MGGSDRPSDKAEASGDGQTTITAWFAQSFLQGRVTLTEAEFYARLRTLDLNALWQGLKGLYPNLPSVDLVLRSQKQGIQIRALALVPRSEGGEASRHHQHIVLNVGEGGMRVVSVDGLNAGRARAALFANPKVLFTVSEGARAAATWLKARIFDEIAPLSSRRGRLAITTDQFHTLLRATDWQSVLAELKSLQVDLPSLDLILRSIQERTQIRSLTLVPRSEVGEVKGHYQHVVLSIGSQGIRLEAILGLNKSAAIRAFAANPHIFVNPALLAEVHEGRPTSQVLVRLSEFGRMALYQEVQITLNRQGKADLVAAVTIDDGILQLAALSLLVKTARDFVAAEEAPTPWLDFDRRFAMARTLNDFLAPIPLNKDDAAAVSRLLSAAQAHETMLTLVEYRRVLRLAGDSPIAESAWDAVFSPELQLRLRAFAQSWLRAYAGDDPAHEYLRSPFNEAVGAFYHSLLRSGEHSDLRWEILTHLFYQQRRGDDLSAFRDGLVKAGDLARETANALVRQELAAFAAQRGHWGQDGEAPTRLLEGIRGGAARFMWHEVLGEAEQQRLIATAREIFPQHKGSFVDRADLSNALPQALFFETLGVAARALADHWQGNSHQRPFDTGLQLINMLMGQGDESLLGFRRGFGERTEVRKLLNQICRDLMQQNEQGFRRWLEQPIHYTINKLVGHEYRIETVLLRRADLLERLMQGLSLREAAHILRLFRTENLTPEQELARAQDIWQRHNTGQPVTEEDKAWLFGLLDRLTAPGTGAKIGGASPGDRWYLVERWLTQDGKDQRGQLFDDICAAFSPR